MSLLYYIMLRAEGNYPKGQVLFWAIQLIWFLMIPLLIIQMPIFNVYIDKEYKMIIFISSQILVIIYDYFYYFKEANKNKILMHYTNKYKIIEDRPITIFISTYLFLLFLGIFACTLIPKNN